MRLVVFELVTSICVSKLPTIGSGNDVPPTRLRAIDILAQSRYCRPDVGQTLAFAVWRIMFRSSHCSRSAVCYVMLSRLRCDIVA